MIWYSGMLDYEVWLIEVEGNLRIQIILPIIPINENDDDALLKQYSPISMDWREVRFDISNDMVYWNDLSPSLTDCSW